MSAATASPTAPTFFGGPQAIDRPPLAPDVDEVRRARSGDEAAFRTLVQRHQGRAYAIAFGVVRNTEDARDIVQDALVRAYNKLHSHNEASSFGSWLNRIVLNLAIDHWRRKRVERSAARQVAEVERTEWDEQTAPLHSPRPSNGAERRELSEALERAMVKLMPIHRAVLIMHEVQDMTYQEMARELRVPKGTIMSRLFHARRYIRKHLGSADPSLLEGLANGPRRGTAREQTQRF